SSATRWSPGAGTCPPDCTSCCGRTLVADKLRGDLAGGPGRGRPSRRRGPRVSGSGPADAAGGIVPAAQGASTVPHRPPAPHSLMPYLVDGRHLLIAARLCMRRASAPGADGVSWADYRQGLRERLADLATRLRTGRWQPG